MRQIGAFVGLCWVSPETVLGESYDEQMERGEINSNLSFILPTDKNHLSSDIKTDSILSDSDCIVRIPPGNWVIYSIYKLNEIMKGNSLFAASLAESA